MKFIKFILIIIIFNYNSTYAQFLINQIPYSLNEINKKDEYGRKQGIWYTYYQNNIVECMQNFKDDTLNGYFENYWYSKGNISEKGYYKDGKLDSFVIGYWENGIERAKLFYKNGKLHGIAYSYDEKGNLKSKYNYIDGVLDSSFTDYFRDPNAVWEERSIINTDTIYSSEVNGKYERYAIYEDENLVHLQNYKNGILINESFFINSTEYKRIIYCEKLPMEIIKIFYFENKVLIKTEIYNEKCKRKF